MKTRCYCIHCPNHPKFKIRTTFNRCVTGFGMGRFIMPEYDEQSATVNCLKPVCEAIEQEIIDLNEYDFPVTAYGDGASTTGFYHVGGLTHATCSNERYEK